MCYTTLKKYAIYEKVQPESCEAQIEKAMAKLRWEKKRSGVDNEGNEAWKQSDCLLPTEGVLLGGDLPPAQGGGGLHVGI